MTLHTDKDLNKKISGRKQIFILAKVKAKKSRLESRSVVSKALILQKKMSVYKILVP